MSDLVFISWSKPPSDKLALTLKSWVQDIVPSVEVFFSKDIDKGREWHSEVKKGLINACYGIICLTPQNIDEKWILFEAGALYSKFELTRVAPLLFDVKPGNVGLPLASLQCVSFDQEEMLKLAKALNSCVSTPLSEDFIVKQAQRLWPELQEAVHQVLSQAPSPIKPRQSEQKGPLVELKDIHEALLRQTEMVQEVYRWVIQSRGSGTFPTPSQLLAVFRNRGVPATVVDGNATPRLPSSHARFGRIRSVNEGIQSNLIEIKSRKTSGKSRIDLANLQLILQYVDAELTALLASQPDEPPDPLLTSEIGAAIRVVSQLQHDVKSLAGL